MPAIIQLITRKRTDNPLQRLTLLPSIERHAQRKGRHREMSPQIQGVKVGK